MLTPLNLPVLHDPGLPEHSLLDTQQCMRRNRKEFEEVEAESEVEEGTSVT
jgi:hypothetical protein